MALIIEDEEGVRFALELAELTGETVDEAVEKALAECLQRERAIRSAARDQHTGQ